jgi:hypothetical protein
MQARKRFNIQYPKLYAESSDAHNVEFNCVQRAHQQTLEWLALCQVLAAVNGMVFPRTAAAFLCVWTVGKLLYIQGYSSGKPSGRHVGGLVAHMGDVPPPGVHELRVREQAPRRAGSVGTGTGVIKLEEVGVFPRVVGNSSVL